MVSLVRDSAFQDYIMAWISDYYIDEENHLRGEGNVGTKLAWK